LDDQAYVDELIAFADADQCIDHDHIFITGFSMGGFFAHENACLRSDIRAVAPHSGGTHDLSGCPQGPKPVLIMHFQGDSMIPYDCGIEARDRWLQHNGCGTTASDVRDVLGGSCEYYDDCPANGQVAMCSFTGLDGEVPANLLDSIEAELPAGHAWSGGSIDGENPLAAISVTESATELSWAFFKEFGW
jgi:poly(3-hydroxybutyrate) depolymerase